MDFPKRTKSPFPRKDPTDPSDASIQVMIRMPFWYAEKLQRRDKTKTVAGNAMTILAEAVPVVKPRKKASK